MSERKITPTEKDTTEKASYKLLKRPDHPHTSKIFISTSPPLLAPCKNPDPDKDGSLLHQILGSLIISM
uniref:Uncharacterized protein n=1 Tax=Romanomermis culicivorax TaxID=13658 RepID=A0A915JJ61_ROMCU